MIEKYLINAGLGCGSVKNFNNEILKNVKLGISDRWYFKTPIKVSGTGLRTAVVDLAFPFIAKMDDVDEKTVIDRIELTRKSYEDDLLRFLRSLKFIVPPDTANFSVIPFWATEGGQRNDRKDFGQLRIHILNANITVKYRNIKLPSNVDAELALLVNEQSAMERKVDKLSRFVSSADFSELDEIEQGLIEAQLNAMIDYNDRLKDRILNY